MTNDQQSVFEKIGEKKTSVLFLFITILRTWCWYQVQVREQVPGTPASFFTRTSTLSRGEKKTHWWSVARSLVQVQHVRVYVSVLDEKKKWMVQKK